MAVAEQPELGRWLKEQRRGRGWDVAQMARRLANAAGPDRSSLPGKECLLVYIRRWERGDAGISERYRLLYCAAFGIELSQFGPQPPDAAAPPDLAPQDPAPRQRADIASGAHDDPGTRPGACHLVTRIREVRDSLRDDAKQLHTRAAQTGDGPVRAALCRGQAMACELAAEYVDAALADAAAPS